MPNKSWYDQHPLATAAIEAAAQADHKAQLAKLADSPELVAGYVEAGRRHLATAHVELARTLRELGMQPAIVEQRLALLRSAGEELLFALAALRGQTLPPKAKVINLGARVKR